MRILLAVTHAFFRFLPFISLLLVFTVSLVPAVLWGGEIKIIPGIAVKETYNDNLDFVRKDHPTLDEMDDFITTYTPSLILHRNTERSKIKLNAKVDIEDYHHENDLDDVGQHYGLTYEYILSPLLVIDFKSSFKRDTTLESELEESGVTYRRTDRESYRIQPGLVWKITEVDSLNFSYNFSKTSYDFYSYSDYTNNDVTITWDHQLSPRGTTWFFSGGYNITDYDDRKITPYDDDYEVTTYSVYSGFNLPLDEKWEVNLWGGIRRTISEYGIFSVVMVPALSPPFFAWEREEKTEKNWGGIGSLAVKRHFERGLISAEINRNIFPSGSGGTIERGRIRVNLSYRLTDLLTGRLGGSWTDSQSESDYGNKDEDYYSVTPSFSYRLGEKLTATLSYTYSEKKYNNIKDNNKAYRNLVFLQITAHFDNLIK